MNVRIAGWMGGSFKSWKSVQKIGQPLVKKLEHTVLIESDDYMIATTFY